MSIETMLIRNKNGLVRINREDYNPEIHEIPKIEGAEELRTDGPTIEEFLTAGYLAENYPPQGYAARSTPEEIKAAIDSRANPQKTPAAPQQMLVTKKGSKFIVVGTDAAPIEFDGIDPKGYASEAAAWEAITNLSLGGKSA